MARKNLDLTAMEKDWRSGMMSNKDIAMKYEMTEGNVRAYARRYKWQKDEAIKAGVKAMVLGPPRINRGRQHKPREPASMEGVAEEYAEIASEVIVQHRTDIRKLRLIVRRMSAELGEQMDSLPDLEDSIIDYYSAKGALDPVQAGNYRAQMQQALSTLGLGSRAKTLLSLVGSMEKLVAMERASFGLDEEAEEKTYEDSIKEVHERMIERRKQQTGEGRVN